MIYRFQKYCRMRLTKVNFVLMIFFLLLIAGPGCEKIIDVELNQVNTQLVIEGNLSSNDSKLEVKISKTGNYFDSGEPANVDHAEVLLKYDNEKTMKALSAGNGKYILNRLKLDKNKEYQLIVKEGNAEYRAVSTLHGPVKIDSLNYQYQPATHFFDDGYRILIYFTDPAEQENYYRLKVFQNEQMLDKFSELFLFDDAQLDGKGIQVRLKTLKLNTGDKIKVQMYSIDKNAWNYLKTFRELDNLHPGSPTPANPVSNFSNGALGYFSAWSMTENEIVIKE